MAMILTLHAFHRLVLPRCPYATTGCRPAAAARAGHDAVPPRTYSAVAPPPSLEILSDDLILCRRAPHLGFADGATSGQFVPTSGKFVLEGHVLPFFSAGARRLNGL